ncbi:MAG: hypothetical protein ACP5OG_04060 [Candidatus Nanoarchaeia archaeon]
MKNAIIIVGNGNDNEKHILETLRNNSANKDIRIVSINDLPKGLANLAEDISNELDTSMRNKNFTLKVPEFEYVALKSNLYQLKEILSLDNKTGYKSNSIKPRYSSCPVKNNWKNYSANKQFRRGR